MQFAICGRAHVCPAETGLNNLIFFGLRSCVALYVTKIPLESKIEKIIKYLRCAMILISFCDSSLNKVEFFIKDI